MRPARLMANPAAAIMRELEAMIRMALRNQMRMPAVDLELKQATGLMKINLKNLRSTAGYGGLYKI